MIEYKQIDQQTIAESFALASYAFNKSLAPEKAAYLTKVCKNGYFLGGFEDGQLNSQVYVLPFEASIFGTGYKMGGIGTVSSYPESRGNGAVSHLMKWSLEIMKENGFVLSYLAPFSYGFYRQFGYEKAFDDLVITMTGEELPYFKAANVNTIERKTWEHDLRDVAEIYDDFAGQHHGLLFRKAYNWEQLSIWHPSLKFAVYYDEDDKAAGYLAYFLEGTTFKIKELITLSPDAYRSLWNFVRSHRMSFETFTCLSGSDESVTYMLKENRPKQELVSSMMARIVDLQAFIADYPFVGELSESVYFEVKDETAPWNAGFWKLDVVAGKGELTKVESAPENRVITGDIQAWVQLFLSVVPVDRLFYFDDLSGSQEALLELSPLLPQDTPVLYDYF